MQEKKSLSDVVVEEAIEIKDKLKDKLLGKETSDKKENTVDYHAIIFSTALSLASIGLVLGIIGFIKEEHKRYNYSGLALCGGTVVFCVTLHLLGLILGIVLYCSSFLL